MATTWEKLTGDTSKFAVRISFSDDPDAGGGSTIEESSSWGSFQIWVEERNLCAHGFAGERAESVHWYMLPLIEWWVENWDPLLHEERLPNRNAAPSAGESLQHTAEPPQSSTARDSQAWDQNWHDWWARHCLEAARFGGVFPSIYFRRWRDRLEISWQEPDVPARDTGVQFLYSAGNSRLALRDVAAPLHSTLKEAVEHLLSRNPRSERLRLLQRRIDRTASLRNDPWVWLHGFGTSFAEMHESWDELRAAVDRLPQRARDAILGPVEGPALFLESFPAALMFGAVSPNLGSRDRLALLGHLAGAMADGGVRPIDELAQEALPDSHRPWDQGYELALECLESLGVDPDLSEAVNIDQILEQNGVQVQEITLVDISIRAIAIGGPSYRPTVLVNDAHRTNQHRTGRRFSLAHELCHLIYDRAHAQQVTLPSGPWAPRDIERRANAFAAMLLMPPGRLTRAMASSGVEPGSREAILDVCRQLQTSFSSTVQHMHNLGLLSEEQRDELLDEAIDRQARFDL